MIQAVVGQNNAGTAGLARFLVAYDFSSASDSALEHAVALARMHQATVRVVHAASPLPAGERAEDLNEKLHSRANHFGEQSISFEFRVIVGAPDRVLRREIASWQPDVCFVGAFGSDSTDRENIGPTVSALLHSLPCIVVVIGPKVVTRINAPANAARIVCAIDFPEDIEGRLRLFAELSRRLNATADLVHVVDVSHEASRPHCATDIQYTFDSLVAQLYLDRVLAKSTLLYGSPEQCIADYAADKRATYILFALHREGKRSSHFANNLVEKVIRNAPCAVMVFPQDVRSPCGVVSPDMQSSKIRNTGVQDARNDTAVPAQ